MSLPGAEESYADLITSAGEMTADNMASSEAGRALLDRISSIVERARILSFLRNGRHGCTVINTVIADHLIHYQLSGEYIAILGVCFCHDGSQEPGLRV